MAGIDRWLHYTVTTIDRFHCIYVYIYIYIYIYIYPKSYNEILSTEGG